MNGKIIRSRIRAIRLQLKKCKIDCLIVTNPANVAYATGFMGSDSWAVITPRSVYLLTDSRYIEQAKEQTGDCRIIEAIGPIAETVAGLLKKLKSVSASGGVTIEKCTSLAAFELLKKNLKFRIKTVANIIEEIRSVKDNSEITAVRAAVRIAAQALKKTLRYAKQGTTENELAGMLDFQIRKLGAVSSFETIVAFGPNASYPHYHPGARKLKKNDTILIDFGVRYKSYCCDLTRCFTVGRPTRFYKKVFSAVKEAQAAALKMVKSGAEIRRVDAAAREIIKKYDLPVYGHGTGHGLGLEVHELPVVSAKSKGRLKAGQIITIEPGVYIPGKLGVRIEDDILVTETGYELLTRNCPQIFLGG
jgi:Xaa-Pro aminopeptidase